MPSNVEWKGPMPSKRYFSPSEIYSCYTLFTCLKLFHIMSHVYVLTRTRDCSNSFFFFGVVRMWNREERVAVWTLNHGRAGAGKGTRSGLFQPPPTKWKQRLNSGTAASIRVDALLLTTSRSVLIPPAVPVTLLAYLLILAWRWSPSLQIKASCLTIVSVIHIDKNTI